MIDREQIPRINAARLQLGIAPYVPPQPNPAVAAHARATLEELQSISSGTATATIQEYARGAPGSIDPRTGQPRAPSKTIIKSPTITERLRAATLAEKFLRILAEEADKAVPTE